MTILPPFDPNVAQNVPQHVPQNVPLTDDSRPALEGLGPKANYGVGVIVLLATFGAAIVIIGLLVI